jgi:hypothetical protein
VCEIFALPIEHFSVNRQDFATNAGIASVSQLITSLALKSRLELDRTRIMYVQKKKPPATA